MACILAGFLLVTAVTFCFGYLQLVSLRDTFTQPYPQELPVVQYAPGELDSINKRIDQFVAHAHGDKTNARLSLSQRDINGLIASAGFGKMAFVNITNESIQGRITIPVEMPAGFLNRLGVALLRGRYLNGEAMFKVSVPDGQLVVQLSRVTVNGQPRQTDLLKGMSTNAPRQTVVCRLQRVLIEGDRLVLESAPQSGAR
jgi:hypothetical protein